MRSSCRLLREQILLHGLEACADAWPRVVGCRFAGPSFVELREPAAAVGPDVVDAQSARRRRGRRGRRLRCPPRRTRVRGRRRVRGGRCRGWVVSRVVRSPRGLAPCRASSVATRCSSTAGAPPIPMLPSSSSAVPQRPCPGTRSKIDRCSTGAPRRRAMASAGSEMSMPSVTMPDSASARAWRAGPQPMSSTGPSTRTSRRCSAGETGSNHRWAGAGRTRPSSARRHGAGDAAVASSALERERSSCLLRVLGVAVRDPSTACAKRVVGAAPATASASWKSSTSRSGASARVRSPSARSWACCCAWVCSVLISTLSNTRAFGSAEPDAPPSAVEGGSEHGVGVGLRRASRSRVDTSGACRVWGVSMPTRNAGPRTCANAFARRSARPLPSLGDDIELGGEPRPGGPSSAMTCRRAGVDASTSSVSASAASARPAASSGVHGGHSRVLTRPGCGDLAMMSKVARGLIAALSPCRGRRVPCPAACP